METVGGSGRPSILWVINVFDRVWDLKVQLRLIRAHFSDRVDIHVFCTGPSIESGLGEDRLVVRTTDLRQDGFRDAMRYTAEQGVRYDLVVSTQAKSWCTDYSVIDGLLCHMSNDSINLMVLDPGPKGCMVDEDMHAMYCDLVMLPGYLSGLLYHRDSFQGCFPEKMVYRHIAKTVRFPYYISHTGGRERNPSSAEFMFPDLAGTDACLLGGYISEGKWAELRTRAPSLWPLVQDIYDGWREAQTGPLR